MNSAMLLFSTLLVLLQNANCQSAGQPCNILAVTDQCDPGLTCVAQGTSAHCQIQCDLATCPPVWCGSHLQYTPEGECCPICPPPPTIHTSSPAPVDISKECHVEEKIYQDGEHWQITDCLYATCVEGEVLQYSYQCAEPECDNPIYIADTCCPICPESREATGESVPAPVPTPLASTLAPSSLASTPLTPTPLAPTPLAPAPVCMIENGETLNDGETYCPQPSVLGTCKSGQMEYQNHCSPLTCTNVISGPNECDCPICVDDAQRFQIAGVLDINRGAYAKKARKIEKMIRELVADAGYIFMHVIGYECNQQMCFDIHVASSDEHIITVDDVVTEVRNELNNDDHMGLEIGYMGDFNTGKRSARSVSDSEPLSLSSSSTDRHSSSTTTVIAVTASVFGVIASVIGIALLASFVHRKQSTHHTITV